MSSFSLDRFNFLDFTEMDLITSRKVWECRNLPQIREFMVNQDIIPWSSHLNFINKLKSNHNNLYYCVLWDSQFVGSLNLHIQTETTAERGIYLHPLFQGKGLSKKLCQLLYDYSRKNLGLEVITTKVLKSNTSSNALERSLGAVKVKEDDQFHYYECDLINA